jgi:hypothetical protein
MIPGLLSPPSSPPSLSLLPSFLPSFTAADTISLGNPLEDHRARRQFHWNLGLRGEVLMKIALMTEYLINKLLLI